MNITTPFYHAEMYCMPCFLVRTMYTKTLLESLGHCYDFIVQMASSIQIKVTIYGIIVASGPYRLYDVKYSMSFGLVSTSDSS